MSLAAKNPTFTILLIDDVPRTMYTSKKSAKNYLAEEGMELNWVENSTGQNITEQLKQDAVDIVLVDQNISTGVRGFDILKDIRQKNWFVDAIFYSVNEDQEGIFQDASRIEYTEVVEGREVWQTLKRLIEKNLARWNDLRLLRGVAISRTIDLELEINAFLENYFEINNKKVDDFRNFVLENSANSFEGKRRTLNKIAVKLNLKASFKDLNTHLDVVQKARNLLAHCKVDESEPNKLVCMGQPENFDKKRIDNLLVCIRKASLELEKISAQISTPQSDE